MPGQRVVSFTKGNAGSISSVGHIFSIHVHSNIIRLNILYLISNQVKCSQVSEMECSISHVAILLWAAYSVFSLTYSIPDHKLYSSNIYMMSMSVGVIYQILYILLLYDFWRISVFMYFQYAQNVFSIDFRT